MYKFHNLLKKHTNLQKCTKNAQKMHKFDKLSILKIHPERYNGAKVERKIKRTLQKAYMDGGKMYVICRF